MALVSSRSFSAEREDTRQKGDAVYLSKARVERNGVLLYIEGDPIDPGDTQTLEEQGYIKAKPKSADKARRAAKNK